MTLKKRVKFVMVTGLIAVFLTTTIMLLPYNLLVLLNRWFYGSQEIRDFLRYIGCPGAIASVVIAVLIMLWQWANSPDEV